MSLQVISVRRSHVALTCDWLGCTNRFDLPDRPDDSDRDYLELRALRIFAARRGWRFNHGEATCPNHPTEAA